MTFSVKLVIAAIYVVSIAYVHLRGRVRHKLGRQLSDHSTFLAPINCFLYLFSKIPDKPYLNPADFPDLSPLQAHWEEIRAEGQNLLQAGDIKRSNAYDDVGFNSFFKTGWKRFYLKWYGDSHPSAIRLCPRTTELDSEEVGTSNPASHWITCWLFSQQPVCWSIWVWRQAYSHPCPQGFV